MFCGHLSDSWIGQLFLVRQTDEQGSSLKTVLCGMLTPGAEHSGQVIYCFLFLTGHSEGDDGKGRFHVLERLHVGGSWQQPQGVRIFVFVLIAHLWHSWPWDCHYGLCPGPPAPHTGCLLLTHVSFVNLTGWPASASDAAQCREPTGACVLLVSCPASHHHGGQGPEGALLATMAYEQHEIYPEYIQLLWISYVFYF